MTVRPAPVEAAPVAASRANAPDEVTNEPSAAQSPLNSRRFSFPPLASSRSLSAMPRAVIGSALPDRARSEKVDGNRVYRIVRSSAARSVARQRDRAPAQSRETVAPCRIDLRVVGIRKKLVGSGCAAAALMSAAAHHGKAPRHDHKAVTR